MAAGACAGGGAEVPRAGAPAPAGRDLGTCADVADLRVCWPDGGAPPRVGVRGVPAGPPPARGWRCAGFGRERWCDDRGRGSGPFVCGEDGCVQRYPRMPDDGEWECIDMAGAVMCRRGVEPAGVVVGPPDPGWWCGPRAGAEPAERVCVDYAPDVPDSTRAWRCRYQHDRGGRRVCRAARAPAPLGVSCGASARCPPQLTCAGGRCLPPRPAVRCWFDDDCDRGHACQLGTCVEGRRP